MTWRNDDALFVKFGTEKAEATFGGHLSAMDGYNVTEFDMDLDNTNAGLTATDAIVPRTDTIWLPAGAQLERVRLTVLEAVTTGDNANLDLGLIYYTAAGVLTELDYNGLLIAADAFVSGAVGEVHDYYQSGSTGSSTDHGALLGTILATTAEKYYFSASEDTGVFTGGQINVKTYWRMPRDVTDT